MVSTALHVPIFKVISMLVVCSDVRRVAFIVAFMFPFEFASYTTGAATGAATGATTGAMYGADVTAAAWW